MLINNTNDLIKIRSEIKGQTVGFVPTMGNLHKGHLSLIEASLVENDITFVSIFVNPTQFGPSEDFNKYPRTLEEDLDKIIEISKGKKIWVFAPQSIEEIYPADWDLKIEVPKLANRLCGKSRPSHFAGVTTVVYRLFSLVAPQQAYFGEKDYQQCLVIKKMVNNLNLPITINTIDIVREADGLALSSRNQFLSKEHRSEALILSKTLNEIKENIVNKGIPHFLSEMSYTIKEKLKDERWEYLEILNAQTLNSPDNDCNEVVVLGALKLGTTRLIDNMVFKC